MGNDKHKNKKHKKSMDTMIEAATSVLLCDAECERKKQEEEMKQKYMNAQYYSENIDAILTDAEKNYIVFTQGEYAYNELRESKVNQKAIELGKELHENYDDKYAEIQQLLESYIAVKINEDNVIELCDKYKKDNAKLKQIIDKLKTDISVNERNAYYENEKAKTIEFSKFSMFYLLIAIYCICCVVLFVHVYKALGPNIKKIAFSLIAVSIAPFAINKIITHLYFLVYP